MPITTSSNTTTITPATIHQFIAHSPCLPPTATALSKRNGGGSAMIERPDVDTLLAGPLGQWLEQQAQVRAAAREKSNQRYVIGAFVVLPLLAFLWYGPAW